MVRRTGGRRGDNGAQEPTSHGDDHATGNGHTSTRSSNCTAQPKCTAHTNPVNRSATTEGHAGAAASPGIAQGPWGEAVG
uniref:Uncharacterized protein n=1 Tax=Actinoplanes tsinanensis TaxID=2039464 RepID=A0A290YXI7_9ACTN|nr:hypothetical protein [Actinoplanes tsinanensis]